MNNHEHKPLAPEHPESATAAPDFAVQPSYVRTVFLGPDGLRAGWGFAFYVAMFYPLQFVAVRWAGSLNEGPLRSMALAELGVLLAAVIPSVVLARVEQRKWGVYGLPGRRAFGKFFWGRGCLGIRWNHIAVDSDVWAKSVRVRTSRHARRAHPEICTFLGRVFPAGGILRRVSATRIFAIYVDACDRVLACGGAFVMPFWFVFSLKQGRP